MGKVLIVDDDADMRGALKEVFENGGHLVTEAEDGRIAKNLIPLSDLDLIISDFRMPYFDGIELLEWVKKKHPCPFILITGFSHILETQKAYEMGADGFISKPFSYVKILEAANPFMKPKEEIQKKSFENVDHQYCQIPIDEFVSTDGVRINIHIRLSKNKYVRVAHKGDQIPMDRVENYKNKGLRHLYVDKNDLAEVVGFNLKIAKAAASSHKVTPKKKLNFLRYTSETVLENIRVSGVCPNSYQSAVDLAQCTLSLLTESDSIFTLLDVLNSHSSWIYAHSLGVGTYGIMVAKMLGWNSAGTKFKIFMAGLLHDIGKKEIAPELINKPRHLLTQDERKLIETHPVRSMEVLSSIKEVPGDVIQVAYEHHEDCLGRGYPQQLNKKYIHPLAKVIALTNEFCKYAIRNPHSEGHDFSSSINYLKGNFGSRLDAHALKALEALHA